MFNPDVPWEKVRRLLYPQMKKGKPMKVYEDYEPNATLADQKRYKEQQLRRKAVSTGPGLNCITCLYARSFAPNPDSDICQECARCSNYKSKTVARGKKAYYTNGGSELIEAGKAIDRDIDEAIRKDLPFCTRPEDNRDMCFAFENGFCVNKDGTCEDQSQDMELTKEYQKAAESIAEKAKVDWPDGITIVGKKLTGPEPPPSAPRLTAGGYPNPLHVHDELCRAARKIMMKKNHDYTSGSGDPYANFRGSTSLGISNIKGILLRVQDKMKRIQTFDEKGELRVKDESVQDAIIDIINYMVLIGGLIEEIQNDTEEKTEEAQEY